MRITSLLRLALAHSRLRAMAAITILTLHCGPASQAGETDRQATPRTRTTGPRTKSFGPEATKQKARATTEQLPLHPRGLAHHPVQPSPGDAVKPRHSYSILEAGTKEMPQPLVAQRGSSQASEIEHAPGASEKTSAQSRLERLPRGADPRSDASKQLPDPWVNDLVMRPKRKISHEFQPSPDPRTGPADALPKKRDIPKLTQHQERKGFPWTANGGTPATADQVRRAYEEVHEIIEGIWAAEAAGIPNGRFTYTSPSGATDPIPWTVRELDSLVRESYELRRIMSKFDELRTSTPWVPTRVIPMSDAPREVIEGGSVGLTPEGSSSGHNGGFPLIPIGQGSRNGGYADGRGGHDPGYVAGNQPDHDSHPNQGGNQKPSSQDSTGTPPPPRHTESGITISGPDPSSSVKKQSNAKEPTKKDNSADKKSDPPKKDPMESQKKEPEEEGLPADDGGSRGGNDVGGRPIRRGARDNRGGIQKLREPEVRAVGKKTGAGDEEQVDTGSRGGTADANSDPLSNSGNDLRGRVGNGSGGAQVPGPTEGVWWYLHGTRAQPPNR